MFWNSLLVDFGFKNRSSYLQKLWFTVSEESFISGTGFPQARLKWNIVTVVSGAQLWGCEAQFVNKTRIMKSNGQDIDIHWAYWNAKNELQKQVNNFTFGQVFFSRVRGTMFWNSLLMDLEFKNRSSHWQKLWFTVSEESFISGTGFLKTRLNWNIVTVASGAQLWGCEAQFVNKTSIKKSNWQDIDIHWAYWNV